MAQQGTYSNKLELAFKPYLRPFGRIFFLLALPPLAVVTALTLLSSNRASAEDWLHTVRPGDTYWGLCLEFTNQPNCWQTLPKYNSQGGDPRSLAQGSQLRFPVEWLKAPPAPATVELVRGDARLIKYQSNSSRILPGQALPADQNDLQRQTNAAETELVAGTKLHMGDKIVTGEGNVLLRFADNSSFLIKSNSELRLERLSAHKQTGMIDTHMRLNYGSGRAKVNSRNGKTRYQISTPAAIAAARGTDFSISAKPATADKLALLSNEVLEGEVAVQAPAGERAIPQGYGTVAEANKAPLAPVKLLPAPELSIEETIALPFVLNWAKITNAVSYNVDVFEGQGTDNLLSSHRINENQLAFPALNANTYTFVVRAIDTLGLQGLEAIATTKAIVQLAAPELRRQNISLKENKASIRWATVEGATSYRVQVAADKKFTSILKEVDSSAPQAELILPGGKVYYARVQAIYPHHGASPFSNTQHFSSKVRDLWLILLQTVAILAVIL